MGASLAKALIIPKLWESFCPTQKEKKNKNEQPEKKGAAFRWGTYNIFNKQCPHHSASTRSYISRMKTSADRGNLAAWKPGVKTWVSCPPLTGSMDSMIKQRTQLHSWQVTWGIAAQYAFNWIKFQFRSPFSLPTIALISQSNYLQNFVT